MRKRRSLLIVALLVAAMIGLVSAFWAMTILVPNANKGVEIDVGQAPEVQTSITINQQYNGDKLVPKNSNVTDAVEYVVVPIELVWQQNAGQEGNVGGYSHDFTISVTNIGFVDIGGIDIISNAVTHVKLFIVEPVAPETVGASDGATSLTVSLTVGAQPVTIYAVIFIEEIDPALGFATVNQINEQYVKFIITSTVVADDNVKPTP